MMPDFDSMARMLTAMRDAYEVGDDKRVRGLCYLLRLAINDLMGDDQSEKNGALRSARPAGLQAGPVRADRPEDTPSGGPDSPP